MWEPISRTYLDQMIATDLTMCSEDQRVFFGRVAIVPEKWSQSPWGDRGQGFWVIAICDNKVLWYNDIEDGFNVSRFAARGRIPDEEYWCNQDTLAIALPALTSDDRLRLGPPQPIRDS